MQISHRSPSGAPCTQNSSCLLLAAYHRAAEPGSGRADRAAAQGAGRPGPAAAALLVVSHEDGEARICALNDAFALPQLTISHHMKVLHEAGLVDQEKRGVLVYYPIRWPP